MTAAAGLAEMEKLIRQLASVTRQALCDARLQLCSHGLTSGRDYERRRHRARSVCQPRQPARQQRVDGHTDFRHAAEHAEEAPRPVESGGIRGESRLRELRGATPALAPGAMVQLGLLGLAFTFRHPVLETLTTETVARSPDSTEPR